MKKLKVALVHDYIKEYGGAERVLEKLHEIFPDAPIYTSVYIPRFLGPHRERFAGWKIHTSWLNYIPFRHKLISPLRLVSPLVFSQFDLSGYDAVIVSATGAYFPNMIQTKTRIKGKNEGAVHICYCHTPPRYLYGYATARDWKKYKVFAALAMVANHFLRMVDFYASKHVDYYIANSEVVAARIEKFYRRAATVIYPPVEMRAKKSSIAKAIAGKQDKMQFFLTGGRLARAKHVDLIVKACSELGVPLKVFGKSFAGYGEELAQVAGPMVEFLGEISDEEKQFYMSQAKAFLFAAEDEDFGLVPPEAMSMGLPVIAYKSGGVMETVVAGVTGILFSQLTVDSLKKAIRDFEKIKIDPKDCIAQAKKFSGEEFTKKVTEFVESKMN